MWLKNFVLFLIFQIIIAGEVGDNCIPHEEVDEGICKSVIDCEVAIRTIQQNGNHPFRRCGFHKDMEIVCCPTRKYVVPKPTKKPATKPTADKFGDTNTRSLRIADKECQKIVETSLPPLGLHIIGGETVSLGEFPHMVALGYERTDGFDFLCGGSLISRTFVLTAAHCVDTLDQVKPSIARMGTIEIGDRQWSDETDGRINEIITHPSYKRRTKYHDLALLRLESPAQFSTNLNPVCLYTKTDNPRVPLTITGWGKTSTTRDVKSTLLLKANVTVVPRAKCGESYTNWRKLPVGISEEQICAGDPQGLRDTCQGDSGGPLQGLTERDGQYRLVGITSFGRGCGSPVPGVYTRVSHYLDWIESVVWPSSD
ncbi:serine protease persephone-like [Vanessa atalanta]|uniref:serine protease persephone-like n=1 Tax=Vanessa atalanta TaxID=42275 RepID=UPI001FCD77F5|nr:serine protease persephone-like [Vanessa atalanta]